MWGHHRQSGFVLSLELCWMSVAKPVSCLFIHLFLRGRCSNGFICFLPSKNFNVLGFFRKKVSWVFFLMCIIWFVFYKGADIELSVVLNMYVKLAVHYPMYNLTANTVTSIIFSRWFMISIQGLILYTDFSIVPGTRGTQVFHYLHHLLVLLTPPKFPRIGCHTAESRCL